MSLTPRSKLLISAVLLAVALPGHAQVTVRREAAGAFFEHRDVTGCIVTRVDIAGLREYATGTDDRGPATSLVETFISRRNECTGQELLRASESGPQAVVFTPAGLDHAFLDGTFSVFDYVSGQLHVAEVHLAWDGQGAPTRNDSPTQSHALRDAVANGTLDVNGENLTVGPSASAAIERIRIRVE